MTSVGTMLIDRQKSVWGSVLVTPYPCCDDKSISVECKNASWQEPQNTWSGPQIIQPKSSAMKLSTLKDMST